MTIMTIIIVMKTVNIAKLKAELSKYLQKVKAGERVVVLDRNEQIAEIVPIQKAASSVESLFQKGLLVRKQSEPKNIEVPKAPTNLSKNITDAFLQFREEENF